MALVGLHVAQILEEKKENNQERRRRLLAIIPALWPQRSPLALQR